MRGCPDDMDGTVDYGGKMTPGFIASTQIAAAFGCALIMNSDQGIPSTSQYKLWNPGPTLTDISMDLHTYLFGNTKTSRSNDITYGSPQEWTCTYGEYTGNTVKNCRILKMKSPFGATKLSNGCIFHFDDNASEAYHVYKGWWSGESGLGVNPIYVGDISHFYTQNTSDPQPTHEEVWYTGSISVVKQKLQALLSSKLKQCVTTT